MLGVKRRPPRQGGKTLAVRWQAGLDDFVNALAWSPDGRWLAAAAVSGPITLFDSQNGAVRQPWPGHGFGTTALAWSPDGSTLASAGQDGQVKLWTADSSQEMQSLAGGASWVERVAWSPAGDYLASTAGRKLRLWDKAGQLFREYDDHDSTIADIAWQPGGRELVVAAYGGLTLRSPDRPDQARSFRWKGSSLVLAWSPDGKYIATGDQDSTVHFWYADTGKDLQMWGYPTKVRELSWNHTSRYLATGGSATVVVWDCSGQGPEGTKPTMLEQHEDLLSGLAYQHQGLLLASAGQDGRLVVWRPSESKKPLTQTRFDSAIAQMSWSPDDRQVVLGTAEGVVSVIGVN